MSVGKRSVDDDTMPCRLRAAVSPEVDVVAAARDSEVLISVENSRMMPVIKSTTACARVIMRLEMEAESR